LTPFHPEKRPKKALFSRKKERKGLFFCKKMAFQSLLAKCTKGSNPSAATARGFVFPAP